MISRERACNRLIHLIAIGTISQDRKGFMYETAEDPFSLKRYSFEQLLKIIQEEGE